MAESFTEEEVKYPCYTWVNWNTPKPEPILAWWTTSGGAYAYYYYE